MIVDNISSSIKVTITMSREERDILMRVIWNGQLKEEAMSQGKNIAMIFHNKLKIS